MKTLLFILGGTVLFFTFLQVFVLLKMKARKGKAAPQLEGKAGRLLTGKGKVLFYFYSPSCRACRPMTPIVRRLAESDRRVLLVDVTQDATTAQKFGVMATPSLVLVEGGRIAEFLVGFQPEERLRALAN